MAGLEEKLERQEGELKLLLVPPRPEDMPNAVDVIPRIMALPTMIEPPEGYIEAFAAGVRKVAENHGQLLPEKTASR